MKIKFVESKLKSGLKQIAVQFTDAQMYDSEIQGYVKKFMKDLKTAGAEGRARITLIHPNKPKGRNAQSGKQFTIGEEPDLPRWVEYDGDDEEVFFDTFVIYLDKKAVDKWEKLHGKK